MPDLNELRTQIDTLDATIMRALSERFALMHDIKAVKANLKINTTDPNRETVVLNRANAYDFSASIQKVYQRIIEVSKDLQR
jgi:Chorismate mutase